MRQRMIHRHAGITQTCGWNRDSVVYTHMRVEGADSRVDDPWTCGYNTDMRVERRHAGRIWTCRKKIFLLKKVYMSKKNQGSHPKFSKNYFFPKIFFSSKKVIKGHQKSKIDIILKRKVFANAVEQ